MQPQQIANFYPAKKLLQIVWGHFALGPPTCPHTHPSTCSSDYPPTHTHPPTPTHTCSNLPKIISALPLLPWQPVEDQVVPLVLLKVIPVFFFFVNWTILQEWKILHLFLDIVQLIVQALTLWRQQTDIPERQKCSKKPSWSQFRSKPGSSYFWWKPGNISKCSHHLLLPPIPSHLHLAQKKYLRFLFKRHLLIILNVIGNFSHTPLSQKNMSNFLDAIVPKYFSILCQFCVNPVSLLTFHFWHTSSKNTDQTSFHFSPTSATFSKRVRPRDSMWLPRAVCQIRTEIIQANERNIKSIYLGNSIYVGNSICKSIGNFKWRNMVWSLITIMIMTCSLVSRSFAELVVSVLSFDTSWPTPATCCS